MDSAWPLAEGERVRTQPNEVIIGEGKKKSPSSPAYSHELGERGKNGPPTIPSLPNGPEVLFFSPKVEDKQN